MAGLRRGDPDGDGAVVADGEVRIVDRRQLDEEARLPLVSGEGAVLVVAGALFVRPAGVGWLGREDLVADRVVDVSGPLRLLGREHADELVRGGDGFGVLGDGARS